MRIVVFRSGINRPWHFRIIARNNRIVAQSEGYKRKSSAIKTARAMSADNGVWWCPIEIQA